MSILRQKQKKTKVAEELQSMKEAQPQVAKSIKFEKEKVDRDGNAFKKTSYWLRKDHLNKLKVIAHFEDLSTEELVNKALGEYVAQAFDKSQVLKKLVTESAGSSQKVKI